MGREKALYESTPLPDTSALSTHSLSAADVQGLNASVTGAEWDYQREPAVGSLLAISSAASPTTTRFLAPPRGPGYQLASVALGAAPARQVVHDTSGRAQVDGAATYEWDDLDELVVVRQAGQPQEVLLYDGVGRLAGRLTQQSGGLGLREAYVYDGSQMAAAFDSGGGLRWEATWGPGIDNLVAVNAGGKELLAVTDFRRDVAGLFDASANRLDYTAQYTPEGRVTTEDSAAGVSCAEVDATRCPSLGGQPFGLHSAWKSDVSGLVYFRNRWYSPELGEFLSHDALGYADSFSLYAFNGFDAVNRWDPFGLSGPGVTPPEPPPPPPAPGYDHASAQERAWAANEARPAPGSGATATAPSAPARSSAWQPRHTPSCRGGPCSPANDTLLQQFIRTLDEPNARVRDQVRQEAVAASSISHANQMKWFLQGASLTLPRRPEATQFVLGLSPAWYAAGGTSSEFKMLLDLARMRDRLHVLAAAAGFAGTLALMVAPEAGAVSIGASAAPTATGARTLSSSEILFSQSSVRGVEEIAASMRASGWVGAPVDVVSIEGRLITIDNTRVLAAHLTGTPVQAIIHGASEALPASMAGRFVSASGVEATTWGEAVLTRIGNQSAGYRSAYPLGSWFTGMGP